MWFIYALLCALAVSATDAASKRLLFTQGTYTVAWIRWAFSIPFLLPTLLFIDIPSLDAIFWKAVAFNVPLEIAAILLYIRALKISPLSLTVPFLALTPVFLVLTSFLILGETVSTGGLIGILMVSFGAYVLNISATAKSGIKSTAKKLMEPVMAVTREKGSLLMIGVAFIYSLTSNFGKVAIQHSSPMFFAVFYMVILSACLLPIVLLKDRAGLAHVLRHSERFLHLGVLAAMMIIFHFLAVIRAEVPYVISVKRTSMIFSVIYGWAWFGEQGVAERLTGSGIMTLGVALIALF